MTEPDVMRATPGEPATIDSLIRDLQALGLSSGDVVIAHTSLSALGWVVGGQVAVVSALERVLGDEGTLIMPDADRWTQRWSHPPAPADWWSVIRDHMPPYDPDTTPSVGVGIVPETLRVRPGVFRSDHPLYSFASRGPQAEYVSAEHSLSYGLGENSPLGRLYDLDARVLLLGVDNAVNTSLHLCEYRLPVEWQRPCQVRLPIGTHGSGTTQWASVDDIDLDEADFAELGLAYERVAEAVLTGPVGAGSGQLMSQRELVDFGVAWMREHRSPAHMTRGA